jgi:protein-S-isoprenylcysteine O-methyltransferase Ste14
MSKKLKQALLILTLNILLSLLAILLVLGLLELDQYWPSPLPVWLEPFAWPLFVPGSALILWAAATLVKYAGSSGAPGDPTKKLVTTGPYRWMRNPIYAGDALLVLGVAFFTRSPTLLTASVILLPLLDLVVRKVEEPRTEQRLGNAYREYQQRVPRWIPRCPKEKM